MPRSAELPGRGVPVAVFTLLVVLLPVLVCGAGLDLPIEDAEVARIAAAANDPHGESLGPVALFYSMGADRDPRESVATTRIASLGALLVVSGALYLAVALARSRTTALLACLALAGAPSVSSCVIRPELPTAAFGMLALLVLVGMPVVLRKRRMRTAFGQWTVVLATAVCVGMTVGLAVATLSNYGAYLLVPGGCMLLAIAVALWRFVAVMRRRPLGILPFGGFTRRVAPWIACSIASLAGTLFLLREVHAAEGPTVDGLGLVSDDWWVAGPVIGVAAFGAVLWIAQLGLSLSRRRCVTEDAVLFVFAVALGLWRGNLPSGADALPSAPAVAIAFAIGARAILVWLVLRLRARSS